MGIQADRHQPAEGADPTLNATLPLAEALTTGPLTLDGGLSTELARSGHDIASSLWSARLLRDAPDAVLAAHAAFLAAGADVITTASYQATFEGFARQGTNLEHARELLHRSVHLARRAQDESGLAERTWVAASVGPYGALLADGSEYTGAYAARFWPGRAGGGLKVGELRAFHRPRLAALAEAGPDVLAFETVPCLVEAEALVAEVAALDHPAWLSLTTTTDRDGRIVTRRDEPASEAFAMARDVDAVIAVGVNCTDPAGVEAAVALAAEVSGKPVVAYPNSGERWDAAARAWTGHARLASDAGLDAGLDLGLDVGPEIGLDAGQEDGLDADAAFAVRDAVDRWTASGARLVGGCCRVGPETIRVIAGHLKESARP